MLYEMKEDMEKSDNRLVTLNAITGHWTNHSPVNPLSPSDKPSLTKVAER